MFFFKKKEPAFFVLGTQKGGTTNLYNLLVQHPSILAAKRKEIHYFEREYLKGNDWYLNFFSREHILNKNKITGEATPYYLYDERVPERIFKNYPNSKFIILLRDPIARAYSHYHMQLRRGTEQLSFEDAIEKEPKRLLYFNNMKILNPREALFGIKEYSYLDRGKYVEQLKRWFSYFPRERFYIQKSELFFENPNAVTNEIFHFLKLKPFDLGTDLPIVFKGEYREMNQETLNNLKHYFSPFNNQLYDLLNINYEW